MKWSTPAVAFVGLMAASSSFALELTQHFGSVPYRPSGKGYGLLDSRPMAPLTSAIANVTTGQNGISYHGGPLMTSPTNVYLIWYGDWKNYAKTKQVITTFITSLTGSPLYNINTSYTDSKNQSVVNIVQLVAQTSDNYTQGKSLTDYGVTMSVYKALLNGKLPKDKNGVYFVLSSPDVKESSGFGTKYCGWHSYFTLMNVQYKFSFVGNPLKIAPKSCGVKTPSPNGDPGGDAMVSVLYHELSEAVTDPMLNAWYDSLGNENGDKCSWTYGTTYTSQNALYNVTLGGKNWLIQQNWVNAAGGYCALSY
ncbi:MAG TPA: hypothetical protein VFM46_07125 [Pseudomonadales bacterium]|nr:hypothetical protein [Pseudomonadales bacterium]